MCNVKVGRRDLLVGLAASPLLLAGCDSGEDDSTQPGNPPAPPNQVSIAASGCYRPQYAGMQPGALGCGALPAFGDPQLDGPWPQEVQIQAQFYGGVPAQPVIIDECSAANANAFATPEGYILFGRNMAIQLATRAGTTLPIAGVLAHEWGHRAQFTFGWMTQSEPTVRRTELEADMWSGLYMGLVKLWTGPLMQSYYQTLFALGDFNFNHSSHHGTPNQRLAAGATGVTLALQLMQTQTRLTYDQTHSLFVNEVTRITTTIQKTDERALKATLDAAADSLTPEAQRIARRMDTDWIRGIALGNRRLEEFAGYPDMPLADRMNLSPY